MKPTNLTNHSTAQHCRILVQQDDGAAAAAQGRFVTAAATRPTVFALLVSLSFTFAACSKHQDPTLPHQDPTLPNREKDAALQKALDELTRMSSFTNTGLNYTEYSDRLLTTKGNIDVALQRTADRAAKDKIDHAVSFYLHARKAWEVKIEMSSKKYYSSPSPGPEEDWAKASEAAKLAAEYAFADESTRQQIDAREEARQKEEMKRLDEQIKAREQARQEQERAEKERQARAAEAEQKRMAEDAERERIRRFAPEGTVYNLALISVAFKDGLSGIPAGTELKVSKKNSDGTLHVQTGDLAADVLPSAVTNDRDLAAALRSGDKNTQEILGQLRARQATEAAAAAAKQNRQRQENDEFQKLLNSKPEPTYVNPLERRPN